jgi:hypothetical protein
VIKQQIEVEAGMRFEVPSINGDTKKFEKIFLNVICKLSFVLENSYEKHAIYMNM